MKMNRIPASIAVESTITDINGVQQADSEDIGAILAEYTEAGGNIKAMSVSEATKVIMEGLGELNTETISISTEGSIAVGKNRIELIYNEDAESGMEGSETRIVFDRDNPGLVTMLRRGMGNMSLVFDAVNSRQHCVYDVGLGEPIQLCVVTRKIENNITEKGGVIELEYLIEMNGISAEYSRVKISVNPYEKADDSGATIIEYDVP